LIPRNEIYSIDIFGSTAQSQHTTTLSNNFRNVQLNRMKEALIKAIQFRLAAATPGPRRALLEGRDFAPGESFIMTGIAEGENIRSEHHGEDIYLTGATRADLDFIALARQDIPAFLLYITDLEARMCDTNKIGYTAFLSHGIRYF
jgi:hypothetical protein